MPIDVRLPISGLFGVVGLLLLGYGIAAEGLNTSAGRLNAVWGAVLFVFAVIIGYYGVRHEQRGRSAARIPPE